MTSPHLLRPSQWNRTSIPTARRGLAAQSSTPATPLSPIQTVRISAAAASGLSGPMKRSTTPQRRPRWPPSRSVFSPQARFKAHRPPQEPAPLSPARRRTSSGKAAGGRWLSVPSRNSVCVIALQVRLGCRALLAGQPLWIISHCGAQDQALHPMGGGVLVEGPFRGTPWRHFSRSSIFLRSPARTGSSALG